MCGSHFHSFIMMLFILRFLHFYLKKKKLKVSIKQRQANEKLKQKLKVKFDLMLFYYTLRSYKQ